MQRRLLFSVIAAAVGFSTFAFAVAPSSASALTTCAVSPSCPRAVDDNGYKTVFNTRLTVSAAAGVLANDTGPAGTRVDLEESDSTSWNGATVVLKLDGSFVYTPDPGEPYSGIDSFDYYITDGHDNTDFATAYVNVSAIVRDDNYAAKGNTPLSVAAPGVFANDRGQNDVSVDADATSAGGGHVTMNDDGSFRYVPRTGFSGNDTFKYTVEDLNADTTYSAVVHIRVAAATGSETATTVPGGSNPTNASGSTTTTSKSGSSSSTSSAAGEGGGSGTTRADGDASSSSGSDDSGAGIALVAGAAVAIATAGGVVWWWRRKRTPPAVKRPPFE